jgi:hypothetical protein
VAGGSNGSYDLNGPVLSNDASADSLFGDAGQDWFLAGSTDQTDSSAKEVVTIT